MLSKVDPRGAEPDHRSGSYEAWQLGPSGCDIVDLAWHTYIGHDRPEVHRLLPHSEPSLVIRRRFDRNGGTSNVRFEITQISPDGGTYSPEPGEEMFGLRLCPEVLEPQLGIRAADMNGQDLELPTRLALAIEPARRLADREHFSEAWRAMLAAIKPLASTRATDRLGHAAALSRASGGRITPAELARLVDLSPRHLRRGFSERFGLSPRGWARRLRITAAMLEAERSDRPDWAGIAAGHRFSDQAHMIRECRAILGRSPSQIHAERRPMAVSFNISD